MLKITCTIGKKNFVTFMTDKIEFKKLFCCGTNCLENTQICFLSHFFFCCGKKRQSFKNTANLYVILLLHFLFCQTSFALFFSFKILFIQIKINNFINVNKSDKKYVNRLDNKDFVLTTFCFLTYIWKNSKLFVCFFFSLLSTENKTSIIFESRMVK